MAMIALGGEHLFDSLNVVKHGWVDGVVAAPALPLYG